MRINQIQLRYFRNYESLHLQLERDHLFFFGNNAQGKTNLLEALYFLSTVRSFRAMEDKEMIQFGQEFSKATVSFDREGKEQMVEIVIHSNGKYLRSNQQTVSKVSDFMGQLNTVLFCPADLRVLFSSPKDRRKFMDMELGKISPQYLNDLSLFYKYLKQRNAYLKLNQRDDLFLEVLTNQMIEVELRIILARDMFLKLLEVSAKRIYQQLSQEEEPFSVHYVSCTVVDQKEQMKVELLERYQKTLEKDKELRMTQVGIHREDFEMFLSDKELRLYGSQGQRRSAILALKIGLVDVIHKKIKEYPILLLDDVLSELDESHRRELFHVIPKGVQTLITATEMHQDERSKLQHASFYKVNKGLITKED